MEQKTLDIMITNKEQVDGEVIGVVDETVVDNLLKLSYEREKLAKRSKKLNEKKAQAIRYGKKIVNQFAKSRQMSYDERTHAVGIHNGETIYLGSRERLEKDPTVEPIEGDIVRGTLTKSEKRLYNDAIQSYAFVNKQIDDYISDLTNNEMQLISFQKNLLKDKECSVKDNYLAISVVDGKVYFCNRNAVSNS